VTAFDAAAERYDAWYRTPIGRLTDQLEKEAIFGLAPAAAGRAADLSCGTGNYALELARRGWRVIGIDRSRLILEVAWRKAASLTGRPAFVQADAAALPVRDGSLDLVTIILGLEFIADPLAVLREARRGLAANGSLVVAVLRAEGLWARWRRLKRRMVDSVWRDAHFSTDDEIQAALRAAGFLPHASRRVVHYGPWPLVASWALRWERVARRRVPRLAAVLAVHATPVP
jgi:ubiquinone/menaquinone biosynthesis C-methylase UbiE